MSLPSSVNHSDFGLNLSTASVDDDVSSLTAITLEELYKAAQKQKTMLRAKPTSQTNALIPPLNAEGLHVKEALLEKEFPHIHGIQNSRSAAFGSIGSMKAERSFNSKSTTVTTVEHSPADPVAGESSRTVNYNDCVQILSGAEMLHLRNAMHNHEKQRLMETMEQFSHQIEGFHRIHDEHEALKEDVARAKRENKSKALDLENRFIEMKLVLARCQSREDYKRLKIARLKMELKMAQVENHALQQKLDGSSGGKLLDRKHSGMLTQSLPKDLLRNNVRSDQPTERKNPLLNHSWFGKDSLRFLNPSNSRGEGQAKGLTAGNTLLGRHSPTAMRQKTTSPTHGVYIPRKPTADSATQSRSFVDSKRARASKRSEFMHWDDYSASSCEEGPSVESVAKTTLGCSLVDLKEDKMMHTPIGLDLLFQRSCSIEGTHAFGSQATLLSNITHTFGTEGDAVAEEETGHVPRKNKKPLPPRYHITTVASAASGGSDDLPPTFTHSQLQHVLDLRGRGYDRALWQETQPQNAKSSREVRGSARPQKKATNARCKHELSKRISTSNRAAANGTKSPGKNQRESIGNR